VTIGVVGMTPLRSSFRKLPVLADIIYRDRYFEKKKYILTSFVALGMRSEGNESKSAEPTTGSSFMTKLQHTGHFWSRLFMEIIILYSKNYPNSKKINSVSGKI
jgi:hypothetical protein